LRAILRQDPDYIRLGEIRDAESAQVAFQAVLTEHLVYSTLHTNSAVATIARLYDLGLRPPCGGHGLGRYHRPVLGTAHLSRVLRSGGSRSGFTQPVGPFVRRSKLGDL